MYGSASILIIAILPFEVVMFIDKDIPNQFEKQKKHKYIFFFLF